MADFRGRKALRPYMRPYNYERVHSGYGMAGWTPCMRVWCWWC